MSDSFNLVHEKWIPVLWRNGTTGKVGILEALTRAGEIREICPSSPFDSPSINRFLIAVFFWCQGALTSQELASVSKEKGFPSRWLEQLESHEARFELLGDGERFYQTPAEECKNPVTYLMGELPAATNIAHFRHTKDGREGLCPGCCALGLVRLSAYATSVKHGKNEQMPAGINGVSPMYVLPSGESLLETIIINKPSEFKDGDVPGWMADMPPEPSRLGMLAAFTWRPRRVWLDTDGEEKANEKCECCGSSERRLIHRISFKPGWPRPFKESWKDDRHVLRRFVETKDKVAYGQAVGFANASDPADQYARTWRRAYEAVLQHLALNGPIREVVKSEEPFRVRMLCFSAASASSPPALYHDSATFSWKLPLGVVTGDTAAKALAELEWLANVIPFNALSAAIPRKARERPEIKAALATASVEQESAIRATFECMFEALLNDISPACAVESWRAHAQGILSRSVEHACLLLTVGTGLRNRDIQLSAQRHLASQFSSMRQGKPKRKKR